MSRSGAERISAHQNSHGFWLSGLFVLICCHGLERISRECHGADRSRYPLVQKVTDYHGADIRSFEMSRIGADWVSRSVIIRITDYISIRTHPWLSLCSCSPQPNAVAVLYSRTSSDENGNIFSHITSTYVSSVICYLHSPAPHIRIHPRGGQARTQ